MTKKRTLTLAKDMDKRYRHWSIQMMNNLANSGLFEVKYEDWPEEMDIPARRKEFLSFFKIDNDLFALDTWDSHYPSTHAIEMFPEDDFFGKTKILFKIQKNNETDETWQNFEDKTGIMTSNWTMFPTEKYPLNYFRWDDDPDKHWYGIISGKRRPQWMEYYRDNPDFFVPPEIGKDTSTVQVSSDRIDFEEFKVRLQKSLWGISLHGKRYKGLDCKNRREVEFSSCGMPMALNYKPEYSFPFNAGEHYFYFENMEDLVKIKDVDPLPFHKKSVEAYDKWFSPKGSAEVLLDIIDKKLK